MYEKNEEPKLDKLVEEDSTNEWDATNDADIGQTVKFQSTITAQAGAENYVLHDKMSAGLDFGSVTGITLNGTTVAITNYTVKTTALTDDCTFEVVFTQDFCDTLKANDQIVISYTATLNENAVVGLPGNPNESHLDYGDETNTTSTPDSKTTTYTWDMDVLKYANGDETKVLSGVKFVLIKKETSGTTTTEYVATVVNGKLTGWVAVPTEEDAAGNIIWNSDEDEMKFIMDPELNWPAITVLTTNANGKIEIDGLDADTYHLREIKVPDGYNMLKDDQTFTITSTKNETETELTHTPVTTKVNNQSGTELPSTGGIGTTIFYCAGAILALGAFVLLVTKKRMGRE